MQRFPPGPGGRCGAVHGRWGTHALANAWNYEVWIDAEGRIHSALSSSGNDMPSTDASVRIVRMLEDFLAKRRRSVSDRGGPGAQDADRVAMNCVAVQLGFDNETSWGPGYSPPGHLRNCCGHWEN